jgi:hypothetical protein
MHSVGPLSLLLFFFLLGGAVVDVSVSLCGKRALSSNMPIGTWQKFSSQDGFVL